MARARGVVVAALAIAVLLPALGQSVAPSQPAGVAVQRTGRSLQDVPTQLTPQQGAPVTQLQPGGVNGTLRSSAPQTRLQAASQPQTLLREAEVPRERLEVTRALIAELKAQPTPQQAISIDLPADVLFDFDKADLRPDAAPSLAKAAELIQSYPRAPLRVVGHTDGKGTDAYNDPLSLRRAQAVAQALQQRTGRQAATEGRGRSEPIAPNMTLDGRDDPAGRQRNRRVQILIEPPPLGGTPP